MKRNPRRNFVPEFKARIALEAAKGLKIVNQIAAENELHPVQVTPIVYGVVILLFCAANVLLITYPYSELDDKGWELSLLPLITAIILMVISTKERIRKKSIFGC